MNSLFHFLKTIPDHRRAQGQRVPFTCFLEMIILAGMSGHFGLRPVARFIQNNSDYFVERYKLNHGVPKGTSVQNFLSALDFENLTEALYQWTLQYLDNDSWLSLDGKAIGSRVSDKHGASQNFKSIVSMFCQEKQIVLNARSYQNKLTDEASSARNLISELELKGITFAMDALHCQKKLPKQSWSQEMTMFCR